MNKIYKVCAIYVYALFAMFIRGWFCDSQASMQNKQLFCRKLHFEGWSISHFMLHFFLGYKYPNHIPLSLCIGIVIELWQYFLIELEIIDIFPGKFVNHPVHSSLDDMFAPHSTNHWWHVKITDIFMNMLGLFTGAYFAMYK